MRTFVSHNAIVTVPAWLNALQDAPHIRQFPVLLVAPTKKAAIEMMVDDMGLSEAFAERITKESRAATSLGNDWSMLAAEGIIDLDAPALYLLGSGAAGKAVTAVRVVSETEAVLLGVFGYDRVRGGRGRYFIPSALGARLTS